MRDLVWSGLLKDSILNHRGFIRADKNKATIKFIGPSYWKRYADGRPDIVDEVLRIIPKEGDAIDRDASNYVAKGLVHNEFKKLRFN